MRRVVGWVAFLTALVGLGAIIHAGAGPTPRWRRAVGLDGSLRVQLTEGEKRAVVDRVSAIFRPGDPTPVLILDPATGQEIGRCWGEGAPPDFRELAFAGGGRWAVGLNTSGHTIHWADTADGTSRRFESVKPLTPLALPSDDAAVYYRAGVAEGDAGSTLLKFDPRTGVVAPLSESHLTVTVGKAGRGSFTEVVGEARFTVVLDEQGRVRGRIPGAASDHRVSDDGALLFARFTDDGGEQRLEAWDLREPLRPARTLRVAVGKAGSGAFDPASGRVVAVIRRPLGGSLLESWDGRRGARLHAAAVTADVRKIAELSPDGRWATVTTEPPRPATGLHGGLVDLEAGGAVEEFPLGDEWDLLMLPAERGYGLLLYSDGRDEFHVPLTGRKHRLPGVMRERSYDTLLVGGQLWRNGQDPIDPLDSVWEHLAGRGSPLPKRTLIGLEWPSRRPLLRLANTRLTHYAVAPDGSFVLTTHGIEGLVQRWDLPPPKPWARIVGVPVAVGAALLGVWAWWGGRKKNG